MANKIEAAKPAANKPLPHMSTPVERAPCPPISKPQQKDPPPRSMFHPKARSREPAFHHRDGRHLADAASLMIPTFGSWQVVERGVKPEVGPGRKNGGGITLRLRRPWRGVATDPFSDLANQARLDSAGLARNDWRRWRPACPLDDSQEFFPFPTRGALIAQGAEKGGQMGGGLLVLRSFAPAAM